MMVKKERHVIHLVLNGKNEYFSSPTALYKKYDSSVLGIGKLSLNNHFYKCRLVGNEMLYQNDKCIIRKGVIQPVNMKWE